MSNNTLFLDDPWLSLAGIGLVVVLLYGELFFHELGHWIFAHLLGYHIVGFSTGQGPIVRQRLDPERARFHRLRLWPVSGFVLPVKLRGHETRLQHFLVYCAGPLFSALFGLAIFALLQGIDFAALPHPWGVVLKQVCQITLVLVGISVLYNAIPNPTLGTTNDGLGMLQSFTAKGFPRPPYPEATIRHALLADGHSGDPLLPVECTPRGSEALLRLLYHSTLEQWEKSDHILESALADRSLSTSERVALLDAFADFVLLHHIRGHAPRATKALEAAMELLPDSLMLRVKHAACQIVDGFYVDGRRNLNYLEADTENPHILACIACTHALADARQGRIEQAKTHHAAAQKLHRGCTLATLAATAIWGSFDPRG